MDANARLSGTPAGVKLCRTEDIADGGARNFMLQLKAGRFHGFVVRDGTDAFGYINRCPHAGLPLAQQLDDYLTPDGSLIACSWHGALFRKHDGSALAGLVAGSRSVPGRCGSMVTG